MIYKTISIVLTCCGIFLISACSKSPQADSAQSTEVQKAVVTNQENQTPAAGSTSTNESENISTDTEQATDSQQAVEMSLPDLVQKALENRAAAELMLFQTIGTVYGIETENDANGKRIALVRLTDKNGNNYMGGEFFCMFELEDAAQLKRNEKIVFLGKVVGFGKRDYFIGERQDSISQIIADCGPPTAVS